MKAIVLALVLVVSIPVRADTTINLDTTTCTSTRVCYSVKNDEGIPIDLNLSGTASAHATVGSASYSGVATYGAPYNKMGATSYNQQISGTLCNAHGQCISFSTVFYFYSTSGSGRGGGYVRTNHWILLEGTLTTP